MTDQQMYIHLVAGGLAGSTGTILTCPLEVIKTRLQSSTSRFGQLAAPLKPSTKPTLPCPKNTNAANSCTSNINSLNDRIQYKFTTTAHNCSLNSTILFKNNHLRLPIHSMSNGVNFVNNINTVSKSIQPRFGLNVYLHLRFILENEGYRALFKGLVPTLVGVVPNRGIYFFSYANSKIFFSKHFGQDSLLLHASSAFVAGFTSVSLTNPIWFVKTRMQLDESRGGVSVSQVAKKIFHEKGVLGFYKGISASYFGIFETAIYFSIYEKLKTSTNRELSDSNQLAKFFTYFGSAGFSKSLASIMCYPHEVARTRLREEGNKYNGFFQTLNVVYREEGYRGLYKGMGTHLMRQIPNSMIVMITYELIVDYFKKYELTD